MENSTEFINVSDYAAYIGYTPQHVYNKLHSGEVVGIQYSRNTKRGWLIPKPKGYDAWLKEKQEGETTKTVDVW